MYNIKYTIKSEDLNYGNHVGNERALIFFQNVRIAFFESLGLSELNIGDNIGVIQKNAFIEYNKQLFLNDEINIYIIDIEFSKTTFTIKYKIINNDGEVVINGSTLLVAFDYKNHKIRRVPEEFKKKALKCKKILVSACLLGVNCRFDGKSKPNDEVINLKDKYTIIPVCPESFGGLPIPRVPSEIKGDEVISKEGKLVTEHFKKGAFKTLEVAQKNNVTVAVLKANSPSCGNENIYDGTFTKTLISGEGIAAKLLKENGITVLNEHQLDLLEK